MADYSLSPVSGNADESIFAEKKWEEKKDRQLRLWGVHGQDRIDNANILLLNATSAGCEVLKNVVLPGFGRFTVVDEKLVTEKDLGANFYVSKDHLGESRAKVVSQLLNEMNPEVKGAYLNESPEDVLAKNPSFVLDFNYIIASNVPEEMLKKIEKLIFNQNIPLIVVQTYGLLGTVRIVKKTHTIVEAKLNSKVDDLRLNHPWDELKEFCKSQDMSVMEKHEYIHTPFLIILMQAIEQWKAKHNGTVPSNREEEGEFKKFVASLNRYPDGNFTSGFDEAVERYYLAYTKPEIPEEVREVLEHPETKELTEDSENFFFLANALSQFVNEFGVLPVIGDVPDFHSDSKRYVQLKDIYWRKNRADMKKLGDYLTPLLERYNRKAISSMEIKEFCKNSHYLRVMRFEGYEKEYNPSTFKKDSIYENLYSDQFEIGWYFMIRAVEAYYSKHQVYAGDHTELEDSERFQSEVQELVSIAKELVKNVGLSDIDQLTEANWEAYAQEMVRAGKAELHNIASLIGGVAAQELIKLCTHQRIPFNGWIFNGIASSSATLEF
mmetsp:Transcript_10302/g.15062  ORF Transcript_10302/g.15062 Transcript_10302/m.15062 type:complete len:552 (+) Transcript_10302:51-1706(+)